MTVLTTYRWHWAGLGLCAGAMVVAGVWPMATPAALESGAPSRAVAQAMQPASAASAASAARPNAGASAPKDTKARAGVPLADPAPRLWAAEPPPEPKPGAVVQKVKPLTPDYWKISGVYGSGSQRRAIVEYAPPRASEYLQVGATLPNGAQILALEKNSVTVKAKVANQWKTIVLEF